MCNQLGCQNGRNHSLDSINIVVSSAMYVQKTPATIARRNITKFVMIVNIKLLKFCKD